MKVVAVVSGGLDSVTMAHHLAEDHDIAAVLSFYYGQRHARELDCAALCAERLAVPHDVVDLSVILAAGHSALTSDDVAVPDGHYAEESMKVTVVPGRNLMFAAVAVAKAGQLGADAIGLGVHGGDHFIYPDCRLDFVGPLDLATRGGYDIVTFAPFITFDKTYIASRADELGIPVAQTWSCYKGGMTHCGTCGTCVERREAFILAGVTDPTAYAETPPLPVAP